MIPFKGRSTLKQYVPQKPVKRGIKVWALAVAINGFISMFQVYTGKHGNTVQKGLGANVISTLTKPYIKTFRHVYFDNFFTSVDLLLDLYQSGLYGCGTVRTNRKSFPQQLKPIVKKGMKERGESKTYQHKNLTISAWQDNKTVTVEATNCDPTVQEQVSRKQKDGISIPVKCPLLVAYLYHTFGNFHHKNIFVVCVNHENLNTRNVYNHYIQHIFRHSFTTQLASYFTWDSLFDTCRWLVKTHDNLISDQ